jgi:hypothetical protein
MLIQMLVHQPQMLGPVLKSTPLWVWGLLAALTALGLSQARTRSASLARIALTPVAMIALSLWGSVSAFGSSPLLGSVALALAWLTAAAAALVAVAPFAALAGTRYDPATRSFTLPGSWIPMLLILGVFLTKYVVGVELAMQPGLAHDGSYALAVSTIYGAFSGLFAGPHLERQRLNHKEPIMGTTNPQDPLERIAHRRAGAKLGWYIHATVYVIVNSALALMSALSGHYWAVFSALGWSLALAIHGAFVFLVTGGGGLYQRLLRNERGRPEKLPVSRLYAHLFKAL